jgi:hypothetical protein
MSFIATPDNYQQYFDSQIKRAAAAKSAHAEIFLSNHSEFDSATTRIRLLSTSGPDEPNPFILGEEWVQRYFQVTTHCALAATLKVEGARLGTEWPESSES